MGGLEVDGLTVSVEGRRVLRGVSLSVRGGEVAVLMGPNGSGKTSLALTIAGHPRYAVEEGRILIDGEDVTGLKPEERALRGLFLAFQSPPAFEGVRVRTLLREVAARRGAPSDEQALAAALGRVGLPAGVLDRELYRGFSGGEKKRLEVAQALLFRPRVAVLDEPDSGLDVEGVKIVAGLARELAGAGAAVLLITHSARTAELVAPDRVLVMLGGRIVAEGGLELVKAVEEGGYGVLAGGGRAE